jgi:hypothetical protein
LLVWLVPAVGLLFDESVQLVELWAKSRPRTTRKIAAKEPQRLVLAALLAKAEKLAQVRPAR